MSEKEQVIQYTIRTAWITIGFCLIFSFDLWESNDLQLPVVLLGWVISASGFALILSSKLYREKFLTREKLETTLEKYIFKKYRWFGTIACILVPLIVTFIFEVSVDKKISVFMTVLCVCIFCAQIITLAKLRNDSHETDTL